MVPVDLKHTETNTATFQEGNMPSETVSVTKVSTKNVPLVSFANGTVRESKKKHLAVGLFRNNERTGKKRKRRIVVRQVDELLNDLPIVVIIYRMYVAEVDKNTGKMTMYPAELFKLHPIAEADLQREHLQLDSLSFREKADVLTDAFGSGKQKRALAKRQRNKLAEGAVSSAMGSVIDSAVAAQQMHTPVATPQDSSSAIPPYNKDADSPAGVYSLFSIIGVTEMEHLKNPARDFFECTREKIAQWQEENSYFPSVLCRLRIMPVEEESRWQSACCLMYLQYMMTLYLTKYDQLRKKNPLPEDWPDAIKRFMLDRFTLTASGKRCAPARLKDLLLSHIIVLCLILDHFTVSLTQLLTDLKLSTNKLLTHIRALGCKVKSETDSVDGKTKSYTAHLTVPLTFPEPSKGRKSKK
ncbi:hypothetical protein BaRGS_00036057 [Batillaria attramentaria]|uniref:DNA-directed RNA polymerase I subunit RPA49 n=1 Tax=Batillaria attramentaria TaxID=370345 RepID=A0ABD0JD45_9CAEN